MPGGIRPKSKATKIAYSILRIPKDAQQKSSSKETKRRLQAWFKDSINAQ